MRVLICSICAVASCGMAFASPIGEAIGKHLDDGDLPGAVSVVVDAQGRMTVDCRGYADLATKTPMRPDTIFWLASNTKAIAAATLMTLVDEGKVKLDDPVSKYMPAFANVTVEAKDGARPPARPMTVRMTLSHMSGLPFFPGMPIDKRPISELARLATVTPLAADPGERYAYSNWGIDVAMAVVEQVTGRSFAAVMKERILVPLGMKDAVFIPSEEQVARLAKSYHLDNAKPPEEIKIGQFRYPYTDSTREPEGGGGLFGTADDLCRFFRMLAAGGTAPDGRRILSERAVLEMTRRQTPDRPKIKSYGFGLNVKSDSVGHGGAYGTYAAFDPRTKVVRVLCISMHGKNARRSAFWSAWGKAVDAYLGRASDETFTNPVIAADWPDPAVWNGGDGWYYSVATGLRTIRKSRNLIDWEDAKIDPLAPKARERLHEVSRNVWAPCVVKLGGKWVLYISLFVSDPDCRIAALVSTSPTGPFEFANEVIDSRREGVENAIDPYVLEVDGKVWMFFGSLADGIHRIELAADGLSVKPGAKPVHVAGVRHPANKMKRAWEGSYLHRHGGWWYLFVSGGHYGDHTYYLTAGRSREITGTFLDRQGRPMTEGLAEPILYSGKDDFFYGPGHNGEIVKSADGRDYIFFHSHVRGYKPNERPTLLQELLWDKDGWPYFKENRPQKTERRFIAASAFPVGAGATDYPVKAADMTNVAIKAGFWLPRFETNRIVTVKADFDKSEETGRLANFREAAKRAQGTFKGCPFDDSDVFKIIEGAAYTLATHPDPKLEKYLDDLIADIAGAQEPDGYLYTARTLGMEKVKGFPRAGMMGPERWSNTGASHEFYNMGHMIEAGVAYWQVTGKRQLLDVAIKAADMMDRTFGYGPGQIQRVPGHEEIELALCKLYRATGEVRYLKLAKTLLDFRGGGKAYNQNHLPVTQQDQACGHAVRAGYLYTAMADVAALLGDPSYRVASERLWKDVVDTKLHLNGGIGAHRHAVVPGFGSVGEAFGAPYDLPNESAYLETCAAIANALWNERLFLFSGDGKYMDVIERIIYNGFLSGISMSGDEFFYPNPLASAGGYARSKWFGCSCCPVNVVRFIPQIAQYAYSTSGDIAYLNLFIASDAKLALASGTVTLAQRTDYPWKGTSVVTVTPAADGQRFALKVRIPGWATGRPVPSTLYEQTVRSDASGISVKVNGTTVPLALNKGYCTIDRTWRRGDTVLVDIPMPVKRIKADARVVADIGRLAVERGPIVWCTEGIDNGGHARDIVLSADAAFAEISVDVCGVRMPALETTGHHAVKGISKIKAGSEVTVKLIPYFAWCHREAGEMQTWFPTTDETIAESGASGLQASFSHLNPGETADALFDGVFPANGVAFDAHQRRSTFWPHKGTDEWVQITLPGEETVRGVDVYWFDDAPKGGCRVPDAWKVQAQLGEMTGWEDVAIECPIVKGGWSRVTFVKPVPAVSIRLQITLKTIFSAGICELRLR